MTDPAPDPRWWQAREPAVAEPGLVSLRGLPPLVVAEVLYGVWQRTRGGAKITDVDLRAVCDALRRHQVTGICQCQAGHVPSRPVRSLLNALARHVRRALADPGSEHAKDVSDLAVFGHRGNLSFLPVTQPWLRQAAQRWAGGELPRHRGRGASRVRGKINALGRPSDALPCPPHHGPVPGAPRRADSENLLTPLPH